MIVVDTNVLVRLITKDDLDQVKMAVALLGTADCLWISQVVLLELGWTLKSRYRYTHNDVSRALHLVVALDRAEIEDADRVRQALRYHGEGMDLGDAFILAFAPEGSTIATFDNDFVRHARHAATPVVVQAIVGGTTGR